MIPEEAYALGQTWAREVHAAMAARDYPTVSAWNRAMELVSDVLAGGCHYGRDDRCEDDECTDALVIAGYDDAAYELGMET